jgi:hypothetical protein
LIKSVHGELAYDRVASEAFKPAHGIKKLKKEIARHYRSEKERMDDLRASGVVGMIEFTGWSQ